MISVEDFEKQYPRNEYTYKQVSFKQKGSMAQTDIEEYEITNNETGAMFKATFTDHMDLKTRRTTKYWEL